MSLFLSFSRLFFVLFVIHSQVCFVFTKDPQSLGKSCFRDGKLMQAICTEGLVCSEVTKTCTYCSNGGNSSESGDSLCHKAYDDVHVCRDKICQRQHLFEKFHLQDVFVPILLLFGGAVAAAGGVGGGGIFVPILILVGEFAVKEAVPLSKALIFGASIANVAQFWTRRHPFADRPLIDFGLAFILQPLALAGTTLGVLFNVVFPNWLILILLVFTLSGTTYKTSKKGIRMWKKETRAHQQLEELSEMEEVESEMEVPNEEEKEQAQEEQRREGKENGKIDSQKEPLKRVSLEEGEEENINSEVLQLLYQESRVPWVIVVTLFAILFLNSFSSVLKGGGHESSIIGVENCSFAYWFLFFLPLPFLITLTLIWANRLLHLHRKKELMDYPWKEGDIKWTKKRLILTGLVAFMAGIMASGLGIGGGMVLSPLMLELAVLPDVTAATSTFMILFTSSSSVIQYIAIGKLLIDYALLYGVIGLVASFLGQKGIDYLVRKYNKKAYIVLAIALVIGVSTIFLFATGLIGVVDDYKKGASFGFKSIC